MSNEQSGKRLGRRDMFLRGTALAATAGLAASPPLQTAQAQVVSPATAQTPGKPPTS